MNTLQPIPLTVGTLNEQPTQLVDARRLHEFLGVRRDFSTWAKARIAEFGFESGVDFLVFDSPKPGNQSGRGGDRRSLDYFLSLVMAKELTMVERTPRGRQARRYFIDCERQLQSLQRIQPAAVHAQPAALGHWERQAINRQAWAEVAGVVYAEFHARREQLVQERVQQKPHPARPFVFPPGSVPRWAL